MALNNFLPFCPVDTGTNLVDQSDYVLDSGRTDGNQPGIARSKLNNKALRQGTAIASAVAQAAASMTGADILDDGIAARINSQMAATLLRIAPRIRTYLSGAGTHNATYVFFIASGNATIGATYTNNAVTFTVVETVASSTLVRMTGSGAPQVSGTLTRTGGSGDATLTFYAVRSPLALKVRLAGGGGGGSGSATGGGGDGDDTTFGTTLLSGSGGKGGTANNGSGGEGGAASLGSGPVGLALVGGAGNMQGGNIALSGGGSGGNNPFGGAGGVTTASSPAGGAGAANTGAGGSGAYSNTTNAGGSGGGAGGYVEAYISSPLSTYAYSVGDGGDGGSNGPTSGGAGGSGVILVEEQYQ